LRKNSAYKTREARKKNRTSLKNELEKVLGKYPADKWVKELSEIGVPVSKVLKVSEILKSEQIVSSGFLTKYQQVKKVDRDVRVATTGIKIDGMHPRVSAPPPSIGEHNDEIFDELGLSSSELYNLAKKGIV